MKHDFRHKLSDYLDGAVTAIEKAEIEEHLKACEKCSDALAELQKTIEQVKQVEDVEPPAWMTQKIMAKVREESKEKTGMWNMLLFPLHMRPAVGALAVLFLAVTSFYIYTNIQPEMKYAEAPMEEGSARKNISAPAAPAPKGKAPAPAPAQDKLGRIDDSSRPARQVPQAEGYKSLDMKYEYEKPAVPAPKEEAASPAAVPTPAKAAEQPGPAGQTTERENLIAAKALREEGKPSATSLQMKAKGLSSECLSYGPAVSTISGVISEKDFPGPPNYESIARGDLREAVWILLLDNPICVNQNIGDDLSEAENNVTEIQLALDSEKYENYRNLVHKPVVVKGALFHSHTGHHRTRVLITVTDVTMK